METRTNQLEQSGVWAVVALAFASLCLPAAAQVKPNAPPTKAGLSGVAAKQFNAFKQRAQLLAPKLQSPKAAEAQQAKADWHKLLGEINQWATQHGIASERSTQPRAPYQDGGGGGGGGTGGTGTGSGSGPGGQSTCAPEKFSGPFWCILEGAGKDASGAPVCLYQCYKIFH